MQSKCGAKVAETLNLRYAAMLARISYLSLCKCSPAVVYDSIFEIRKNETVLRLSCSLDAIVGGLGLKVLEI